MAKILLPAVINAMRGRIGGLIFSINTAGTYVVGRPPNRKTQTPAQRQAAAAFTAMIKMWNTAVTAADKTAWKSFGAAHPATTLCGGSAPIDSFAAFAKVNRQLQHSGQSPLTTPPASFSSGGPGSISLTYAAGNPPSITVTPGTRPSHSEIPVISATKCYPNGRLTGAVGFAKVAIEPVGSHGPWNIGSLYLTHFRVIRPDSTLRVQVIYYNEGSGAKGTPAVASLYIPA